MAKEPEKQTVLDYIEHCKGTPKKVTVRRTVASKYLYYVLVRHYRQRLGCRPSFMTYSKSIHHSARSTLEEHSLLDDIRLFALEGFSAGFVASLNLPEGTFVVAETDEGELEPDHLGYLQGSRRAILRTLIIQLQLAGLSLRELLKQDWSGLGSFEEFEPVLRRAKLEGWNEEQIGQHLSSSRPRNVLALIKRGAVADLAGLVDRIGPQAVLTQLTRALGQVIHLRALKETGAEEDRLTRELNISRGRLRELEEAAAMLTAADTVALAERLVRLDGPALRNPELAVQILTMNFAGRVRR